MGKVKVFKLGKAFSKAIGEGAGTSYTVLGKEQGFPGALIGAFGASPGEGAPMHSHERDEVFVLVRGKGTLVTEGKEIELEPNDFVLVPKNVKHAVKKIEGEPWYSIWVVAPHPERDVSLPDK